jgi:hypothetical protein
MEALKGALLVITLSGNPMATVHALPFSTMANCEKARDQVKEEYQITIKGRVEYYSVICVLR